MLIYIFLLGVFFFLGFLRKGPILVKGIHLFKFQAIFLIFALVESIIYLSFDQLLIFTFLLAFSFMFKDKFIFLKSVHSIIHAEIEKSLKMILLEFEKNNLVYSVTFKEELGEITTSKKRFGSVILKCNSGWPLKKKKIFLKLLGKQFNGVMPKIVINLNRK